MSGELVRLIAEALVERPGQVRVEERGDEIALDVHPDDRGKVIGREGRTIQALRSLLAVSSRHQGRAWRLDLLE